jgi:hypothetical protein
MWTYSSRMKPSASNNPPVKGMGACRPEYQTWREESSPYSGFCPNSGSPLPFLRASMTG